MWHVACRGWTYHACIAITDPAEGRQISTLNVSDASETERDRRIDCGRFLQEAPRRRLGTLHQCMRRASSRVALPMMNRIAARRRRRLDGHTVPRGLKCAGFLRVVVAVVLQTLLALWRPGDNARQGCV
jgi:hypothetical protein